MRSTLLPFLHPLTLTRLLPAVFGVASAFAQSPLPTLSLARIVVVEPMELHTTVGAVHQRTLVAAVGADVAGGLSVGAGVVGSSASLIVRASAADVLLHASCNAGGLHGVPCGASTGNPAVVVELNVPNPMRLRLQFSAGSIVTGEVPPLRSSVDVGNDGRPELVFVSPVGTCSGDQGSLVIDAPAGVLAVRLQVEAELPESVVGAGAMTASTFTNFVVEPMHVELVPEGSGCGAAIVASPEFDGTSVSFFVGPGHIQGMTWLVLGTSPTNVSLAPLSCGSLLVQPEVVLGFPIQAHTTLPLGHLGPVELLAQGVVWHPQSIWGPQFLGTSSALRLIVH